MPDEFIRLGFTEEQARYLRHELDKQQRSLTVRIGIVIGIIAAMAVLGILAGTYVYTHKSHELAIQNCHRSQDGRRAQQLLVFTVIPPNNPPPHSRAIGPQQQAQIDARTPEQKAQIAKLYRRLNRLHALDVPKC